MMYTKNQVQRALYHLRDYSIANGQASGYAELFLPLLTSIETYFEKDAILEESFNYTLHQLALDIQNRKTEYARQDLIPISPSDAPRGYDDVSILFNGGGAFGKILNCGEAEFLSAFTSEVPNGDVGINGAMQLVTLNKFLNEWQAEIIAARHEEVKALQAIADFCESGSYANGLVMLFADLGQIVKSISREELAKQIYIECGYKAAIENFSLNIYVPAGVR